MQRASKLTNSATAIAPAPHRKALLVIDVQENLLKPGSRLHVHPLAVFSFIENLNKSIEFFEETGMPVLYTVNEWTNPLLNILTGNVCKKGTEGTSIDTRVIRLNDTVYRKSRNNALTNRELAEFLKENEISQLYIAGLFAEACIRATVRAATANNYSVKVIEDAVGSKSEANKSKSLSYCRRKGATIIIADQLWDEIGACRLPKAG